MPKKRSKLLKKSLEDASPVDMPLQPPTFNTSYVPSAENQAATETNLEGDESPRGEMPNAMTSGGKDVRGNSLTVPMTVEDRISKLEMDSQRVQQILMKIIGFIDQANKSNPATALPAGVAANAGGAGPGGLGVIGQLLPTLAKVAEGLFSGPAQPAADPFQMEVYKGMVESFKEGFKSYIQVVNQNAAIGAQVVEAIKKGTLKMETVGGAAET